MALTINFQTRVAGSLPPAVRHAADHLERDIRKVFFERERPGSRIELKTRRMEPEGFRIAAEDGALVVSAADELGFIYGLYEISRAVLGVHAFWFWNDQKPVPREDIRLADDFELRSVPHKVRYRGWFVNDEVLLHTWSVDREQDKPWEMVFEALLRCGGNMVIPGTDKNAGRYADLAAGIGLIVTHHHAEPLGAEMFARAYPSLSASYDLYPEKFHALWQEAIERQRGRKIIWNLGFRGQGDKPFWEDDACYATDRARGKLMGELIQKQYEMVKAEDGDAVCCTNLYGETMELYQKGCLRLPDDVIKIWADNGYGRMVSRRQGNDNPRICSMPQKKDDANGIYYHVSFYDLQAANHITMLPNAPEMVKRELTEALERGGGDFWLVNCSNVKPHVYFLDLIAQMWKTGTIDIAAHRREYVEAYYGVPESAQVAQRLAEYPHYAVCYGKHEDERAGEQFTNHVARMLITQYMKDEKRSCEGLFWAVPACDLHAQVRWYRNICGKASVYRGYVEKCEETDAALAGRARELFRDSIYLQARIYSHCLSGAFLVCESIEKGLAGDYQAAFYRAGKARKEYLEAERAMHRREHGKWHGFYANECLTDVKQTAWVLEGLMSYLRALGDGPHYYAWQRDYLYSESDRRVMLVMNMENHLTNEELFALMEEKNDD